MFKRWIDLKNISNIIIGLRRSGKTTLLRNLFPEFNYVTLDDLDSFDRAIKDPKGFMERLGNRVIIDEIQRVPKLTIAVKYVLDNVPNSRFYLTGSSSLGLLDSSADTLAGRIDIVSLPTCCWGEQAGPPTHKIFEDQADYTIVKSGNRMLEETIIYGGFPEVIGKNKNEEKKELLRIYKNSYFTRDIMQLSNIENIEGLLAILNHIAKSICSNIEVSNFARESSLSYPSAKKYLNILNQSQLTFKLLGYQYGPAKKYIKSSKVYYSDNGILSSLGVNISEGQLIENFVISELEKRRKLRFIDCDSLYYYKSSSGREIDIIIKHNNKIYACEIKNSKVANAKDTRNILEFCKSDKTNTVPIVFYRGEEYKTINGAKFIPIASLYRGV